MTLLGSILQDIWKILKENCAAIALAVLDYEESRVHNSEVKEKKAEADLEIEKANQKIDRDNAGKSDADIIDDAIKGSDGGKS